MLNDIKPKQPSNNIQHPTKAAIQQSPTTAPAKAASKNIQSQHPPNNIKPQHFLRMRGTGRKRGGGGWI